VLYLHFFFFFFYVGFLSFFADVGEWIQDLPPFQIQSLVRTGKGISLLEPVRSDLQVFMIVRAYARGLHPPAPAYPLRTSGAILCRGGW